MEMSRLTRDGTAEPVSRDQVLRHTRGQENIHFPCSAGHKQDWQPYPVDPYSAICDDHTYIHAYVLEEKTEILNRRRIVLVYLQTDVALCKKYFLNSPVQYRTQSAVVRVHK